MTNTNGSMPAHPSAISNSDGCVEDSNANGYGYGLSKREHFAVMAMQGILANSERRGPINEAAEAAVMCADALLKELANETS
jgi:hypothetical protein